MTFIEGEPILSQTETYELTGEEKPLLTDLQIKILKSVAGGKTNLEIARDLGKTEQTVKNYFWNRKEYGYSSDGIFARLNAHSRREAVVKAISWGLLNSEELVSEKELERIDSLSEREMEILSHLADHSLPSFKTTDREIADKLGDVSPRTVRDELTSIYKKLEIKELERGGKGSRAAVIFLAYQRRQESTFSFHETPRGPDGVGD